MSMANLPAVIGPYRCGNGQPLLVIAGPCVLESRDLALRIASRLAEAAGQLPVQLVFKASFDKANRTSLQAFRGPGLANGLRMLDEVRQVTGLPGRPISTRHHRQRLPPRSANCSRSLHFSAGRPTCLWRPRTPDGRFT